jgi:hypothetical protein
MIVHTAARAACAPTSRRANRARIGRSDSATRLRAVLANLTARHNGLRATAAEFLASIGADADTIRRYASQLGIRTSKLMRELGAEPARNGLAVITRRRHAALVEVNTYPRELLAAAAVDYNRTAHLAPAAPESEASINPEPRPEAPTATIAPAKLALQLSDRYYERTPGTLRTVCRQYVTERVADIVEGMHRTRANYDRTTGLLTDEGAAIVTQIIHVGADHDGWQEIGRRMDERENARTAALNGASR